MRQTRAELDGAAPTAPYTRRLEAEIAQLRQALSSRPVIDQAQGMLMALVGCSAEEAWHVLVKVSQRTNTKLRDVAAALVATARGDELPASVRVPLRRALSEARRLRRSG